MYSHCYRIPHLHFVFLRMFIHARYCRQHQSRLNCRYLYAHAVFILSLICSIKDHPVFTIIKPSVWWTFTFKKCSEVLYLDRSVFETFDHVWCINSSFIAENLGPLASTSFSDFNIETQKCIFLDGVTHSIVKLTTQESEQDFCLHCHCIQTGSSGPPILQSIRY